MAVLDSIDAAIAWLEKAKQDLAEQPAPSPASPAQTQIAYGSRVSPTFKERVIWMAGSLGCQPNDLMACMDWEDADTFKSGTKNAAGSGAVGLIQFMPSTAIKLGTTVQSLSQMTPEAQLEYVYKYFQPYAGRLNNLGDVYMAILWPAAIGKSDDYVLFDRAATPIAYKENAGLDGNKDGRVTRGECLVRIQERLTRGLQPNEIG